MYAIIVIVVIIIHIRICIFCLIIFELFVNFIFKLLILFKKKYEESLYDIFSIDSS